MEKHVLSKSTFIRGAQCLKSLYLNKKRPFLRDRLSDAQRAVFKRGTDVGILAQQLFPEGTNLKPRSPALYRKKVMETQNILQSERKKTLYEAAFQYNQLLVLLDILVKNHNSTKAYEVKSSLKISDTFLLDAAFQYYVITRSGVSLDDFFLVTLNPDYVLSDTLDIQQLFCIKSVLNEVKERQPWIEKQIEKEKEALQATSSPKIPIGTHCHKPYACDFIGHCWKKVPDNSLLYLDAFEPEIRFKKYYDREDLPEKMETTGLNSLQKVQLLSAKNRKLVADRNKITGFIGSFSLPPLFLSVFFIRPAVPFVNGSRPYEHLPLAALVEDPLLKEKKVTFFTDSDNPIISFEKYLTRLTAYNRTILVYDQSEIRAFLDEQKSIELSEKLKLSDLQHLFKTGILFHYLFRGDYSARQAARIILHEEKPDLDPSLLSMHWQRRLFEQKSIDEKLKTGAEIFLREMYQFTFDLFNYLKNKN